MKRYLPFVIVIAAGLTAVGTGTALYRAWRPAILSSKQAGSETEGSGHSLGPANAPVTLEEFGDFQCPPCGKISEPINELQRQYGSRLRVVFRNFPLAMHQHSKEAARAAEAA